tara:strand:+ start:9229 stop:9792 length:564 start_codon:yes stop_codon:yes gene_type:complete
MDNQNLPQKSEQKYELAKREEVIRSFSPMVMLKTHRHIKTVQSVLETTSESLSVHSNGMGEDALLALIELHIWGLNESMNLNNKLKEMQVVEIALEIFNHYYYLKMEDIFLVFRRAKMGDYGKLYSSLSMIDIFSWFSKYDAERTELFIEKNTAHIHHDSSERNSTKDNDAFQLHKVMVDYKIDTKK